MNTFRRFLHDVLRMHDWRLKHAAPDGRSWIYRCLMCRKETSVAQRVRM